MGDVILVATEIKRHSEPALLFVWSHVSGARLISILQWSSDLAYHTQIIYRAKYRLCFHLKNINHVIVMAMTPLIKQKMEWIRSKITLIGMPAPFCFPRFKKHPPKGLSFIEKERYKSARRKATRRQKNPGLPWYKQPNHHGGSAQIQYGSSADNGCYCPEAGANIIVSIFIEGDITLLALQGNIKPSIEWNLSKSWDPRDFDAKIEGSFGVGLGFEASLTIGGSGKGNIIDYFNDY